MFAKDNKTKNLKEFLIVEEIGNGEQLPTDSTSLNKIIKRSGRKISGNRLKLKTGTKAIAVAPVDLAGNIGTVTYKEIFKDANRPILAEGMIPIKYNNADNSWYICSEEDPEWFDYKNKRWANVMLSDGKYKAGTAKVGTKVTDNYLGSMFVWLPRFAYSIKSYKTRYADSEGIPQNITDVSFLMDTSNMDERGNVYPKSYTEVQEGTPTPKIVHSGFTFDGKELCGLWVAKFEASKENDDTSIGNNDVVANLKVLPQKVTWRNLNIENANISISHEKNYVVAFVVMNE